MLRLKSFCCPNFRKLFILFKKLLQEIAHTLQEILCFQVRLIIKSSHSHFLSYSSHTLPFPGTIEINWNSLHQRYHFSGSNLHFFSPFIRRFDASFRFFVPIRFFDLVFQFSCRILFFSVLLHIDIVFTNWV